MNDNSLIKDIGRSYIVSSLLPAGLFVSFGFLLYKNFLNLEFITSSQQEPFSTLPWIILSASIIWVAFALYSTVDLIIQIYEGYILPVWVRSILVKMFVIPRHRHKIRNITESHRIRKYPPKQLNAVERKIISQAHAEYFEIESTRPLREADLLPTRLGNVMRASEIYAGERFGFNGLVIWPRLSTLLPESMKSILEEKNNHLIFLLNSSFLSCANGMIALIIWASYHLLRKYPSIYETLSKWELQNLFLNAFDPFSANAYCLIGLVWFLIGFILYCSSVSVAETFGLLIRSSFDLYRFDLLKQLNHPVPKSLKQEREIWAKLNEFIVNAGNLGNVPLEFEYVLRSDLKDQSAPEGTGD